MERTCLKCGFVNAGARGGDDERCPGCEAIYSRVEAAAAAGTLRPIPGSAAAVHIAAAVATPEPTATPAPPAEKVKGADEKFCADCGAIINRRAEICPKCGVRQMEAPATAGNGTNLGEKSRIVAALLALILGGIGIHKFYLGRNMAGILYLLFCWTLIPALIALVEGISYLMMSDRAFTAKYG